MDPSLQQAITLIKAGRRDAARVRLARLLRDDPTNARAWLWLATVVADPRRRRFCVQQAIDLDPTDPQARRLWEQLFRRPLPPLPEPAPPPLEAPLLPALGPAARRRPATGRWWALPIALAGLLLFLLGALSLYNGGTGLADQVWLPGDAVAVSGEVVALNSTAGGQFNRRYTVVYRFPTGDRLTGGEAVVPRALWESLARGDAVTVRYDPAAPERSQLRAGALGLGPLLPDLGRVALGLLLLLGALPAFRAARRSFFA